MNPLKRWKKTYSWIWNLSNLINLIHISLEGAGSCIDLKLKYSKYFLSVFLGNRDWFVWSPSSDILDNED